MGLRNLFLRQQILHLQKWGEGNQMGGLTYLEAFR